MPLGQTETFTYDGNGNLLSKTDFNSRTTTYTYDSMNRLLSKNADPYFVSNHLGAASVTFTYTASGQRATMSDGLGGTSYLYDNLGRLQQKYTPVGHGFYTYDLAGNQTSVQVDGNVAYYYDALNRLAVVGWQVGNNFVYASYTYDAVGNLATVTDPNGVTHTYAYDAKNRLKNVGVTNGGTTPTAIAGYAYTVDAAGHRTSVSELNGRTVNYGYDNMYRLTNETIAGDPSGMNGAVSYSYDPVGNRTQKVSTLPGYPGGLSNYNANDQLTTDTYDAEGNTTASNGTGYVYDFENHLLQANGVSYTYDGDGNRVQKTVAGVTTNLLVEELNPTGYPQVLAEEVVNKYPVVYMYGLELLYEGGQGNPVRYYVHDGHGSVRALTDTSGNVTDTYDYDAFGNLASKTDFNSATTTHTHDSMNRLLSKNSDPLWFAKSQYGVRPLFSQL